MPKPDWQLTEEHIKLLGIQKEFERQFHKKFVGLSVRDTIVSVSALAIYGYVYSTYLLHIYIYSTYLLPLASPVCMQRHADAQLVSLGEPGMDLANRLKKDFKVSDNM